MISLNKIQSIVLDIEGTTSSISFVHETMFPYAKEHAGSFIESNFGNAACVDACEQMAVDAGQGSVTDWLGKGIEIASTRTAIVDHVHRLIDDDVKATGLKQLQGLIWKAGFESGQMRAHVYNDVPPALATWQSDGFRIYIYSSGSVQAQKLFFGHTLVGDLLPYFSGHWDTKVGAKREAASYHEIAKQIDQANRAAPESILFVSDVPAELDAAELAGLQTVLSIRPGNQPVDDGCQHPAIESFADLELRRI